LQHPQLHLSLRQQAEFGALYGAQNVAISGIHTHSGPGGYLQYLLYDITSLGFVRESFDALVDGIALVSRQRESDLGRVDM
jgi:neutral ceramidase